MEPQRQQPPSKMASPTEGSPPVSDPGTPTINDLTEATRRLQNLTRQVDGFLHGQFQRLSEAMLWYAAARREHEAIRQQLAEFDFAKQQWSRQRDQEVSRLEQASQDLAAAWQALEKQQRKLLIQSRGPEVARATSAAGDRLSRDSSLQPVPALSTSDAGQSLNEIEMLKSQIRSHGLRKKG